MVLKFVFNLACSLKFKSNFSCSSFIVSNIFRGKVITKCNRYNYLKAAKFSHCESTFPWIAFRWINPKKEGDQKKNLLNFQGVKKENTLRVIHSSCSFRRFLFNSFALCTLVFFTVFFRKSHCDHAALNHFLLKKTNDWSFNGAMLIKESRLKSSNY